MAYGVINPVATMATNIDSLNRSCISASNVEQGGVFELLTLSTTAGEAEVWTATVPTSALMSVWMAYDPELVWTGSYRGLNPDVRDYIITAGRTFSAFRPKEGDLILMSEDAFVAGGKGVNTFANTTAANWQLVWGATQTNDCLAFKYRATKYFSIGTGAMDNQRFTAYLMEVLPFVIT